MAKPQLIKLREPLTTAAGTMMAGVYEIVGGPVPKRLRDAGIPFDGPAPADVKVVDATQFDRDEMRFSQPAAAPERPATIDRAKLLAQYGWDDEKLDLARQLGFPAVFATQERRGERVILWRERDVEKWEARIAALGFTRAR